MWVGTTADSTLGADQVLFCLFVFFKQWALDSFLFNCDSEVIRVLITQNNAHEYHNRHGIDV